MSARKKDPWDDPEVQAYLARANRKLKPMISGSRFSVMVATEPDAKVAIELGFMILFDKPIIVVATREDDVNEHLRRVADEVVIGDPREPATHKAFTEAIGRMGVIPEEPSDS